MLILALDMMDETDRGMLCCISSHKFACYADLMMKCSFVDDLQWEWGDETALLVPLQNSEGLLLLKELDGTAESRASMPLSCNCCYISRDCDPQ